MKGSLKGSRASTCSSRRQSSFQINEATQKEYSDPVNVPWRYYKIWFLEDSSWAMYLVIVCVFGWYAYANYKSSLYLAQFLKTNGDIGMLLQGWWIWLMYTASRAIAIGLLLVLIAFENLRKSKKLSTEMLRWVAYASFDLFLCKTPSGHLQNRFSRDLERIDFDLAR